MSASNVVVEAGARAAGLRPERVLAVELGVHEESYTEELIQLPNLEGKPEAILRHQLEPDFAAGNSVNDIPMLRMAKSLSLCINPCDALYAESLKHEWVCARIQRPALHLVHSVPD